MALLGHRVWFPVAGTDIWEQKVITNMDDGVTLQRTDTPQRRAISKEEAQGRKDVLHLESWFDPAEDLYLVPLE